MGIFRRLLTRIRRELLVRLRIDPVTGRRLQPRDDLVRLGNTGGAWTVPSSLLGRASIVYCAGCGEDISFDLALITKFGCEVHGFDPTPRAITYVAEVTRDVTGYHFHPLGLWEERRTMRFFAPKDPTHVSHSLLNLQGTSDFFEAEVMPVSDLQNELGHTRIDLLKLDIEGAEYKVLSTLIKDRTFPRVLCVEFDEYFHPLDAGYGERIKSAITSLIDEGYAIVFTAGNANYTLVRSP